MDAAQARQNYFPLVVALSFLMTVVAMLDRAIISVLMPAIKGDLNLSDGAIGILAGLPFALFMVAVGVPLAWLADKRGQRAKIAALSLFVWACACMGCGAAGGFISLFAMRMMVGAGEGVGQPSIMSVLMDSAPDAWRRRAVMACSWGALAGQAAAAGFGGWMVEQYGWRLTFVAAGAPGILLALAYFLWVREPQRQSIANEEDGNLLDGLRALSRSKPYVVYLIGVAFATSVLIALSTWLPTYFTRRYDINMKEAGGMFARILLIAGITGPLFYSWIGDRLAAKDRRWPLWMCATSTSLALPFLTSSFFVSDKGMATVLLGVGVFLLMGLSPILPVAARDLAPAYKTAGIAGQTACTILGAAVLTWLIGFVSDRAGAPDTYTSLQMGMLVAVPVGLIGAIFYALAARYLGAAPHNSDAHFEMSKAQQDRC